MGYKKLCQGWNMKLSGKDRALLISHKLHRGLYKRVPNDWE